MAKYQRVTCKKLRVKCGISSKMPLIEDRGVSELTDMEEAEEMSESVRKTFTNYIDKYKVKGSPLKEESDQKSSEQTLVFDSESDYEKP
jgi:hypothetical protein